MSLALRLIYYHHPRSSRARTLQPHKRFLQLPSFSKYFSYHPHSQKFCAAMRTTTRARTHASHSTQHPQVHRGLCCKGFQRLSDDTTPFDFRSTFERNSPTIRKASVAAALQTKNTGTRTHLPY